MPQAPTAEPAQPVRAYPTAPAAEAAPPLVWRSAATAPHPRSTLPDATLARTAGGALAAGGTSPASTTSVAAAEAPPAAAAAAAEPLDLQLLAERVTRLIARGMDIERDRRGGR